MLGNYTKDETGRGFDGIMKDMISDWLDENEGRSIYACDLTQEITMADNVDGGMFIYTEDAINFIKDYWDKASEAVEDYKFCTGEDLKVNAFSNPVKFTFFMEEYGVRDIICSIPIINDNWNEEIVLTPEMIRQIKNEMARVGMNIDDKEYTCPAQEVR